MSAATLRALPAPSARAELLLAVALVWAALVSIPIALGGIGLSWDALNHHIYLGWVADHPRFDRDWVAASYQSYQYPYLYWPAYKLAMGGASGLVAGVVLVSLHVLAVPALWLIARVCIPGSGWYATAMRIAATVLGCSGQLFLSLLDTTANDGLAAVPFVWAVAFGMLAAEREPREGWLTPSRCILWSGLMAGFAVAFKLSNGPLAMLLPVLWLSASDRWAGRMVQVARGSAWTIAGFVLAYGWWGWLLWQHLGNPIFPFADPWFEPLRQLAGHHP